MLIDTDDGGWIFPVNCLVEGYEREEVAYELREIITDRMEHTKKQIYQ